VHDVPCHNEFISLLQEEFLQSRKEHEIEIASKTSELAERATRVDDREARVTALEQAINAAEEKRIVEDSKRREQLVILETELKRKQDELQKQQETFTIEIQNQRDQIEFEKKELRARDASLVEMQKQLSRRESEFTRQKGELEKRKQELGLQAEIITKERSAFEAEKSRWKGSRVTEDKDLQKYIQEEREKLQNELLIKRGEFEAECQANKRAAEQNLAIERDKFDDWCAKEKTRIQSLDRETKERDVAVRAREKASEAEESRNAKGKVLNFGGRKVLRLEGVKPHSLLKLRSSASSREEINQGFPALMSLDFSQAAYFYFRLPSYDLDLCISFSVETFIVLAWLVERGMILSNHFWLD
jgi:hypothetical protein